MKLKILFSIFILLIFLLNFTMFIFAGESNISTNPALEAQKNAESIITIHGKEYHLNDSSNVETITENGKNYICVNSYVYQINNRTLGFEIIIGFIVLLFAMILFRIYF